MAKRRQVSGVVQWSGNNAEKRTGTGGFRGGERKGSLKGRLILSEELKGTLIHLSILTLKQWLKTGNSPLSYSCNASIAFIRSSFFCLTVLGCV
jgi:hypothetical protein